MRVWTSGTTSRPRDIRRWAFLTVVALFLIGAPFLLPSYPLAFLGELLIWGLFAISFDILYGYTGMLSFGQSIFFGMGAFAVALGLGRLPMGLLGVLVAATFIGAVVAAVIGYFTVRLISHYFAILTLVCSLIFFRLALEFRGITGGDDGVVVNLIPLSVGGWSASLLDPWVRYYFTLVSFIAVFAVVWRVINSPLGRVFRSIRENEDRARLLGYNVRRYKLIAVIISGAVAGLAGGLYAIAFRFASAELLHWTVSGEVILFTLLGGLGTLIGPIVGATIFLAVRDEVSSWFAQYPILIGALIILCIIFAPRGIVGLIQARMPSVRA